MINADNHGYPFLQEGISPLPLDGDCEWLGVLLGRLRQAFNFFVGSLAGTPSATYRNVTPSILAVCINSECGALFLHGVLSLSLNSQLQY